MVFCIEKELFCEGTFAIEESNLFFGMRSAVPFTPRNLVSADSLGKFYQLFPPLGNTTPENTKVLSGIISILKSKLSVLGK